MKKSEIILICIVITLVLSLGTYIGKYNSMKADRDIQHNNSVELQKENQIITITVQDLKDSLKLIPELKKKLKEAKIRPNSIKTITRTIIEERVDTVYLATQIDTSKYGMIDTIGCFFVDQYFDCNTNEFHINALNYWNEITNVTYLKKKKTGSTWFFGLIPVKKKFIELHSISSCGETKVEQLNIQK